MSVTALLLTALLNSVISAPRPLACVFPGADSGPGTEETISLQVQDRPSLFDSGGWYQVRLHLSDHGDLKGAAGHFDQAKDWDVLIRGKQGPDTKVAIGLRRDGKAVLKMAGSGADETTRMGHCRDFENYLRRWTS